VIWRTIAILGLVLALAMAGTLPNLSQSQRRLDEAPWRRAAPPAGSRM
jgi:hypothetical protein